MFNFDLANKSFSNIYRSCLFPPFLTFLYWYQNEYKFRHQNDKQRRTNWVKLLYVIIVSITRFRQQKELHIIDLNYIYGSTGFWIHPDVVFLQFSLVTKLFLNLTDAHIAVFF